MGEPAPTVSGVFPREIITKCDAVRRTTDGLLAEEWVSVRGADEYRQCQFATSRRLLRAVLSELGASPVAVPSGPDGAPAWPVGVVGSVSYKAGWCAVAVSNNDRVAAIGLDLEKLESIPEAAWEDIVSPAELSAATEPTTTRDAGELVNIAFCAKEAIYKAQYPLLGEAALDFRDLEVELDLRGMTFETDLRPPGGTLRFEGRIRLRPPWLACGAAWYSG